MHRYEGGTQKPDVTTKFMIFECSIHDLHVPYTYLWWEQDKHGPISIHSSYNTPHVPFPLIRL